jgi:hypothetical protein
MLLNNSLTNILSNPITGLVAVLIAFAVLVFLKNRS